jgi:UDP-N-acetylglucosamine 4-epimerase
MKILITGGAGFIGSHIVDFLLKKNYKVRILDNLSTGKIENISHNLCNKNLEFVWGDISDLETTKKACKGIRSICHQAAVASVATSIQNPLNSHRANVDGFINILLSAIENKVKRIVYASSSSVYGDDDALPKIEEQIGNPISPYAATKRINEIYAKTFSTVYNLETIGLRYFNVFGPRQSIDGPYPSVIPIFINQLKNNFRPVINGDGSFSRDFTYVSNVVDANFLALKTKNKKCFGENFNIGNNIQKTILETYQIINKYIKSDKKPIFGPKRKGDVAHTKADVSKSFEFLGYQPKVSFEQGIKLTLESL